jgi:hypothetical protein
VGQSIGLGENTSAGGTATEPIARGGLLHKREGRKPEGFPQIGAYVRRWARWTNAGLRTEIADARFRLLVAQ